MAEPSGQSVLAIQAELERTLQVAVDLLYEAVHIAVGAFGGVPPWIERS
jgi:hypothetical protein